MDVVQCIAEMTFSQFAVIVVVTSRNGLMASAAAVTLLTGEGYYRNAYDFAAARDLLLQLTGRDGNGLVARCAHDPLTGIDHRDVVDELRAGHGPQRRFDLAFRPEYNEFWDYRIWLDISPELALRRGVKRDSGAEGLDEATALHRDRDRYHVAQSIYLSEVAPRALADAIIDNSDYDAPELLRLGHA